MISNCFSVNEKGHLTIGGADTVELAHAYGTPLYVLDEETIRDACRRFKASIDKNYGRGVPLYASKAFSCKEIYRVMESEGIDADVVSGGEIYTALAAGFPAERMFFHGNNKSPDELELALTENVGRIVVDNLTELETLEELAKKLGKRPKILFRIKPGVDAHTHDFIRTGQIDSKFGFAIENGEALAAAKAAAAAEQVELVGVHCHIGSQIFELEPFILAAKIMLQFMAQVREETGISLSELNLGGGFGIKYLESDTPREYNEFMDAVSAQIHESCAELGLEVPAVFIEPGRSIVGPAGLTLYTVGAIKEIAGVRTYLAVDGGMTDNPRYALYQAPYEAVVANKADQPRDFEVTIAGKCCESGDLIQEGAKIQQCKSGDLLAVLATGAYNYSMASNYNRIPRPAVVMVRDGQPHLIVKRESYADLIRNDL
ncbi:MAG: diaminopimelate decarboxylase [Candidatus Howiella sp.]|jgi:diaminopimelate decarboxylase